jgi:hypothetical protein
VLRSAFHSVVLKEMTDPTYREFVRDMRDSLPTNPTDNREKQDPPMTYKYPRIRRIAGLIAVRPLRNVISYSLRRNGSRITRRLYVSTEV